MEIVIISEKKKSILTDLILNILFCVVPLIFLIKWMIADDEGRIFIVFLIIMALILPCVTIAGYIWDVKRMIVLSEDGIKLCYGRSFSDVIHFTGSFSVIPEINIPWDCISGFLIDAYEQREPTEGGGYEYITKHGLIIKLKDTDRITNFLKDKNSNYYYMGLNKLDMVSSEILKTCEEFHRRVSP